MSVAVGQILDKYELLERVGQGGMAVVYRGRDRSLGREVAIKVLHEHLAEFAEARERFEREAQAVAKLRHENILEIYDFSGEPDPVTGQGTSYIVTEFIDGQTLDEFTDDHAIQFPEIGAMIASKVCSALAHAHGLGILHRDIKPENVMIRSDGVLKLMDFGIAQMLDLQRMTVTGQLLGSPAYMAPEHVLGKPLDFRTDVFAVGVVLYQLCCGALPFTGKNPHEILKRIADGRHSDPRVVNPRVGNELGKIIDRALEREPDDRYADISEMQSALERYLESSGLGDVRGELTRFFAAPAAYQLALGERLPAELARRGHELLAIDRVAALELFNRVLTIDPDNRAVLAEIERLSRRRRVLALAALAGVVAVAALAVYGIRAVWRGDDAARVAAETGAGDDPARAIAPSEPSRALADGRADPSEGAMVARHADADAEAAPASGDATAGGEPASGAGSVVRVPDTNPETARRTPRGDGSAQAPGRAPTADTGPSAPDPGPVISAPRRFVLNVSPRGSEYRVDAGPWHPAVPDAVIELPPGAHDIAVRNATCCTPRTLAIPASKPSGPLSVDLQFRPASLVVVCDIPGMTAQLDGRPIEFGVKQQVNLGSTLGVRRVEVSFHGETRRAVTVEFDSAEHKVISCRDQ